LRWRDALAEHSDAFLGQRSKALQVPELEQDWIADYRERRRAVVESYKSVAHAFRKWIRGIDPDYLPDFRNEPVWFDIDSGPDDSPDGQVEKLWLPVSLPSALDFWDGWSQGDTQKLFSERVEWADLFIERLRNPIPAWELRPAWRIRARRWFRRNWRKLHEPGQGAKR
jgi:hypothetical protein